MSVGPVEVIVLVLGLAVWVVLAVLVGQAAQRRGRSFAVFFLISLLFSWLLALAILLILPRPSEDLGAWGVTTGPDSFADDQDPDAAPSESR